MAVLCAALAVTVAGCDAGAQRVGRVHPHGAPMRGAMPGRRPRSPTACTSEATRTLFRTSKAVRIRVSPCRTTVGQSPTITLTNVGEGQLGYGPGFELRKKTREGWRSINARQAFTLPLLYLKPGETSAPESVAVYFGSVEPRLLEPGTYRVTKGVQLRPGRTRPPVMAVAVTFEVVAEHGATDAASHSAVI